MAIKLYPQQDKQVVEVRQALTQYNSVLMQAPTGSGKTVIASYMSDSASSKNKICYFICHRIELIDQTAKTFTKFGISFGYIANGYPENHFEKIQICSIGTLVNRLGQVRVPHVCIWDEAHHVAANSWAKVRKYYNKSKHIGLSATPERLDGKGLSAYFEYMVIGPTVRWLMDNGYLSDYTLYSAPHRPDMSQVHTRMGDFVSSETSAIMDNSQITGGIVRHWLAKAPGKTTIGFAVSVKHSQHVVEEFKKYNVRAVHLDAKTPKSERRAVAKALARKEVQVVFNVGLFGEGFDLAALAGEDVTVDSVIDAAPTQSLSAYLQRVGRGLRVKKDGSKAILLDHADNWRRHGLPDDDRMWTLDGDREKREKAEGMSEVKSRQCKKCYAVHAPAPVCPMCGYEYVIMSRKIEEIDNDMVQINSAQIRENKAIELMKAETLDELVVLGKRRGYKNPEVWASHIYSVRQRDKRMKRAAAQKGYGRV